MLKEGDLVFYISTFPKELDSPTILGISIVKNSRSAYTYTNYTFADREEVYINDRDFPDDFICHAVPLLCSLFGKE